MCIYGRRIDQPMSYSVALRMIISVLFCNVVYSDDTFASIPKYT